MSTGSLNLTGYDELTVDFTYVTVVWTTRMKTSGADFHQWRQHLHHCRGVEFERRIRE